MAFISDEDRRIKKNQLLLLLFVLLILKNSTAFAVGTLSRESCSQDFYAESKYPLTVAHDKSTIFIPDDGQVELISRLAKGIHSWKTTRDHGWWECGNYYETGPETEDKAILLAYRLVRAAEMYTDSKVSINVWGLAATIANESSFDRCAVGFHFRKWAINKKLMKQRTRTISYGEGELLGAMDSPKANWWFENTGVDVGYCQLLTRFYEGEPKDMMNPVKGLEICAQEFRLRSNRLGTSRPWRWWRGHKAVWYDDRVTQKAKRLGARPFEI